MKQLRFDLIRLAAFTRRHSLLNHARPRFPAERRARSVQRKPSSCSATRANLPPQLGIVHASLVPSTKDQLFYCKCKPVLSSTRPLTPLPPPGICFGNFTIVPLYMPAQPSKPCLTCTRQFCLDQKLPICRGAPRGLDCSTSLLTHHSSRVGAEVPDLDNDVGTGKEGDVEARCFRTSSPSNPAHRLTRLRTQNEIPHATNGSSPSSS